MKKQILAGVVAGVVTALIVQFVMPSAQSNNARRAYWA